MKHPLLREYFKLSALQGLTENERRIIREIANNELYVLFCKQEVAFNLNLPKLNWFYLLRLIYNIPNQIIPFLRFLPHQSNLLLGHH